MNRIRPYFGLLALLCGSVLVSADTAIWTAPDLDSRTYPFVGQRSDPAEPVFGASNVPEFIGTFDNRDSQLQFAFDTASNGIPAGLAPEDYAVTSIILTITASTPIGAPEYDPTYDDVSTYQLANGPAPAPDDPGRPLSLFGAGFRNGYTGWEFGVAPVAGPPLFGESGEGYGPASFGQGIRHVYPIDFDAGSPRDASNNLDESNLGASQFNVTPFAIGTTPLTPGDAIMSGDVFSFSIDLANPDVLGYVRAGLAAGELGFVLAPLHPATGGPGGGGGGDYPFFFLTENGSSTPTLEIVYQLPPAACVGDVDGDGKTDAFDFGIFAPNFGDTGFPPFTNGDLDGDGDVDAFDFGIFAPDFGCAP